MSKEMKNRIVPKLRFPEFREAGEWEEKELGEKTSKVGSGITPNGGDKVYKKEGRPFVRSQNVGWGTLILDDIAFIDNKTHSTFLATEIKLDDVLLNITGASIGRSAIADSRIEGGNVNQHVCIIRTKTELLPIYLNQYLLSNDGQKQIDSFQAGGNRQGLNFAQIRSLSIPLPPIFKEQQKIAACLTSLDDLISAEGEKLKALQAHKKGLMQQLFPAEGETVPRVRFGEFEGEWEEKTLKDACQMQAGKFVSASNIYERKTNELFPCYGGNGLRGYTKSFTHNGKYCLIGRQGALCGNVNLAKGKFHATEHAVVATTKEGISTDWLFYLLTYLNLNQYATGQAQPGLSVDNLEKVEIKVPKKEAEQQKIAACLTTLDDHIAAQGQKLEGLRRWKKGLMQGMFPSFSMGDARR